jgi:hypothetical protein
MSTRTRTPQNTRASQNGARTAQTLVLDSSAFDCLDDRLQRSAGVERSELRGERSEPVSERSEPVSERSEPVSERSETLADRCGPSPGPAAAILVARCRMLWLTGR